MVKVHVYCNKGGYKIFESISLLCETYGLNRSCFKSKNHVFFLVENDKGLKAILASRKEVKNERSLRAFFGSLSKLSYPPIETGEMSVKKQKLLIETNKEKLKMKEQEKSSTELKTSMSQYEIVARGFHETNEANGFNDKTFEGCGTLVKNMDSNTKVIAPLLGNLVIDGKKITLIGEFINNDNGNPQVKLKGFSFGEKELTEEEKVDKSTENFFSQEW